MNKIMENCQHCLSGYCKSEGGAGVGCIEIEDCDYKEGYRQALEDVLEMLEKTKKAVIRDRPQFGAARFGILNEKIRQIKGRPARMKIEGELGFRTFRNIKRLQEDLPYTEEYIVGQISGDEGLWSNFPRFHGDIAGRYILAMTYAESAHSEPPGYLQDLVGNRSVDPLRVELL